MQLTEIRVAGFGGQGVILTAMIIGKAASLYQGAFATLTQSFGPEARGGACSAQVILSETPVSYPYVTQPDVLIVMSQEAYSRFVPEMKTGGLLLVEQDLVHVENHRSGIRVYSVPATRLAEELGKRMVQNMVMVGFFTAVTSLVEPGAIRRAIVDSVNEASRELNLRAFDRGFEYGSSQLRGLIEDRDADQTLDFQESL
jgi:2-oxoglutarate ferredoxin oxidoreductase subunit gamma